MQITDGNSIVFGILILGFLILSLVKNDIDKGRFGSGDLYFYVNLFYEIEIRVCVFLMFYVLFVVIIMHLKLIVDERRKRKEEKENKKKEK